MQNGITVNGGVSTAIDGAVGAAHLHVDLRHHVGPERLELCQPRGDALRFGRARSLISWDFYNALNSDATISVYENYGSFQRPTQILNARVMKFTVNFDSR